MRWAARASMVAPTLRGTSTEHRATLNSITADDAYERQCRRTKPPISLAKPIACPVVLPRTATVLFLASACSREHAWRARAACAYFFRDPRVAFVAGLAVA